MVDVIPNQVQNIFGNYGFPRSRGIQRPAELSTDAEIKNHDKEQKRSVIIAKRQEKQTLKKALYEIKETQVPVLALHVKTLQGLSCKHCSPLSERQLDPSEKCRDATDILRVTQHAGWRPDSSRFDWGGWFPFLAQCLRLARFPYPQVSGTVIKDPGLVEAIERAANDSVNDKKEELRQADSADGENTLENFDEIEYYEEMLKFHQRRAKRLLIDMRSKISDALLRLTSWILYKLLPCFMSGVVAHPAHIEMLKAAAEKAPNVPLIFLPLHRSHLDYILVSFILLNNDIRAPIVAAGDNLRIPFFGALLRGLGAFFIKRKIDPLAGKKDIVYRALLHTYTQNALKAGHNVEFFIEGGRTRTGKPCMPKSGVLSVIIDAFTNGTIQDALLVPVSVNYERLVDGNFVYEQLGQRKKPETFKSAISAIWQILNSKYGVMRIDFNEPFSLGELVNKFEKKSPTSEFGERKLRHLHHQPSTSSLYGTDVVQEEHRTLVDNIARHVVYDCASATAVMTTNAVAFLLLTRFRDGVTMSVFAEALDELRTSLQGSKDIGFTGDSKDVIKYAAELLGPNLIAIEKRGSQLFFKPNTQVPHVIELSYYANALVSHFALDSIMVTALQTRSKEYGKCHPNQEFTISKSELFNLCIEHCDILRYEFILRKPCQEIESLLMETLDRLKHKELISMPEVVVTRRLDDEFDDSDDESFKFDPDKIASITLNNAGHCHRLILASVVAPYSHTYLAVAASLPALIDNPIMESEFVKLCLKEITSQVEELKCKYAESISTDTIRNCIKMFEKLSVIEITSTTGVRLVSLGGAYDSKIIQRIKNIVVN